MSQRLLWLFLLGIRTTFLTVISPSKTSGISCSKSFSRKMGDVLDKTITGLCPLSSTLSITPRTLSPFLKKSEGICLSLGKMISLPSSSTKNNHSLTHMMHLSGIDFANQLHKVFVDVGAIVLMNFSYKILA